MLLSLQEVSTMALFDCLAALFSKPVIESNAIEEVTANEESISSKRMSAMYSMKQKQSLNARFVYGFFFFITNLYAWFFRDYGQEVLASFHSTTVCQTKECFHESGVLRVSFGCFIFFMLMLVTTSRVRKLHNALNLLHSSWWSIKIVVYLVSMILPFFAPSKYIRLYGEIARVGAGIFLLLQLISVVHFINWCENHWMQESQNTNCGIIGLFFSTVLYIATFSGIGMLYLTYVPDMSCTLNIFLISWTAILVQIMMIVSLNAKVNKGLLSSAIMSIYVVYLWWSTIQSESPIEKCSTQRENSDNVDLTIVLNFLFAVSAIVMATFSTGIDSKAFQFAKDEIQLEDDIPYNYGFFHFIFSIGAMHFAMLFINWELDPPTKKWSIDIGWVSTLVKIINELVAVGIYLWKLISPVLVNNGEPTGLSPFV